jgi:hypothetical protein
VVLTTPEDDMWSQVGLFKSDEEYREGLIKSKATKYRKEATERIVKGKREVGSSGS